MGSDWPGTPYPLLPGPGGCNTLTGSGVSPLLEPRCGRWLGLSIHGDCVGGRFTEATEDTGAKKRKRWVLARPKPVPVLRESQFRMSLLDMCPDQFEIGMCELC